jgi:predicted amidohydrolase YtcJ
MPVADVLILNGRVITSDDQNPRAEAVAIVGSRVAFVGSNEEAKSWRGPSTRVFDAQGCTVMPGFIDSHFHLRVGSVELQNADLVNVATLGDLESTLRKYAQENQDSLWVNGSNIHYEIFPEGSNERLTRQHLDAIIADRPVAVMAYDHHTLWANTRALEIAGVLHGAKTGANTEIVMGVDGLATGEVREPDAYMRVLSHTGAWGRAMGSLVGYKMSAPNADELAREREAVRNGTKLAVKHGVTSVHNMDGDFNQASLYAAMEDAGELPLRVYIPFTVVPETSEKDLQQAVEMQKHFQGEMVHAGSVKFFMDGIVEAWTALLSEDYATRAGWKGDAMYSAEHFNRMATAADKLGLQIIVHAIGDSAVRRTLDGYEAAMKANGRRDSRHRIEHIELIHPDDLSRFAELGVIASMQPYHRVPEAGTVWAQNIPEARWKDAFAWQTIRDAGARMVFGSDWPVVTLNPMQGFDSAINYQLWKPGLPRHAQSLADTIHSYTRDAAYAEFQEHKKGQLRNGYLADLVVLSADVEQTPVEQYLSVHPVLTVCGGRIVFES